MRLSPTTTPTRPPYSLTVIGTPAWLRSKNADSVSKLLNKNKFLRELVRREKAYVEITPNFLIKDGFVTSVEFIVSEKLEIEKIEKNLIEIAKSVEKIK